MIIDDVCEEKSVLNEAQLVWSRKGNNIVKKYRCTTGIRKGRIVSNPSQCSAPIDIKKKIPIIEIIISKSFPTKSTSNV